MYAVKYTHLSRFHKHTEPSAAHEAIARHVGDKERVAWGWNTIAPARSSWPLITLTSSQSGTDHNLHNPLLCVCECVCVCGGGGGANNCTVACTECKQCTYHDAVARYFELGEKLQ